MFQVDKGMRDVLQCDELFDCKQVTFTTVASCTIFLKNVYFYQNSDTPNSWLMLSDIIIKQFILQKHI